MKIRQLFIYFAMFVMGILTAIYFVSNSADDNNATTSKEISVSDWEKLQQRNLHLEQENNQLKILLEQQETIASTSSAKKNVATVQANLEKNSTSTSSASQLVSLQEYEKARKFSDWIINSVKNANDINRAAENGFLSEPIDPQWAGQQESRLRTTLSQDEGMGNFALKDVQCRTSLCQVSFAINSVEEAETITNETRRALESLSRHVSIISAPDPDKSVTHLYVSLDEKGFAFIP
ncbi:MAG: hypothetical protein AAGC78_19545 [Cellvibrio sp.]|uniref:hypothetical protein n=1 Tax=Cellvibrio sp. TaxID=1965322 RepID=UPI0031B16A45